MNSHVILGAGEIGSAYARWLRERDYAVYCDDIDPKKASGKPPKETYCLHVCIRYSRHFVRDVNSAIQKYRPSVVNVMSTVPPGTSFSLNFPGGASHSTTRGLHPNIYEAIGVIPKHYGGPQAQDIADIFADVSAADAGRIHPHARTTELLHLASNYQYWVNVAVANEVERWCRAYSVDYPDFLLYSQTHNRGYIELGLPSKVRPVVWPGGKAGGHCIRLAAELIPAGLHGPLTQAVIACA